MRRDDLVVSISASRAHGREVSGSISDLTEHYHHLAAVGNLLTLNWLGGGTMHWFVFTMCITLLYMSAIYIYRMFVRGDCGLSVVHNERNIYYFLILKKVNKYLYF